MKGINVAMVGATEVLARTLAVELAPIQVNVIVAGPVQSDLLEKLAGGKEGVLKVAAGTLTKQVGPPEGIAEAYICFTCVLRLRPGKPSSWTTGYRSRRSLSNGRSIKRVGPTSGTAHYLLSLSGTARYWMQRIKIDDRVCVVSITVVHFAAEPINFCFKP
jgi:hypothetical protein